MKRILCTGRIVDGKVRFTRPSLEELIDAQMARNAEVLAMHRDLDALLAGKPVVHKLTAAQLEAIENEQPGDEYRWLW